ncbi:MAG: type II toxin-antitoxin system HipA family toxin [Flexilinea sp.]|nr:type II toxin-antitoxin system HipA family toxin [Flexilinea sp.]
MEKIKSLDVSYGGQKVGTLALTANRQAAFQYTDEWLDTGFAISPISLPLKNDIFYPKNDNFDGLFGVFDDSLPDGWGRLITDRKLIRLGIMPGSISVLHRLALVGENGKGALSYHPVIELENEKSAMSFDEIAGECQLILDSQDSDNLDELYRLGGSSGGARPKIQITENGEDWIVKFPSKTYDPRDVGLFEYRYNRCAQRCGIDVPEAKLFPSEVCSGYFGVKRFDRTVVDGKTVRKHMLSAAALLEVSYRVPSLDYISLMQLTLYLTHDYSELEKMYRLMCFNVFAHNQDDHAKNFSWLYENGKWRMSPAYDLTYSSSYFGEHATSVSGKGKDIGLRDLYAVAEKFKLSPDFYKPTAEMIREYVNEDLAEIISMQRKLT